MKDFDRKEYYDGCIDREILFTGLEFTLVDQAFFLFAR